MTTPATAFQFKITLLGIEPAIWRRIQLSSNCFFWDLHVAIQDSMGWKDRHLHVFRAAPDLQIGIPEDPRYAVGVDYIPGWTIPVWDHFAQAGDSIVYTYDFGDDWAHEILLEALVPCEPEVVYPRCLTGERACPPEDCGGPPGYADLLAALADPGHDRHDDLRAWVVGDYDPDRFDPRDVRFDDPAERLRKAQGD